MNKGDKDYSRNVKDLIYIYNILPNIFNYMINDCELLRRIKANNSKRYLHAISKYNANKYTATKNNIDRSSIFKNARGKKDKLRGALLFANLNLYCMLTSQK